MIATTWVLIILMGNATTSQKIEGYTTKESCETAATIAKKGKVGDLGGGRWDAAVCLPKN